MNPFLGDEFWGLRNRGILQKPQNHLSRTKIVHGLDVLQKDQHPIQPEPQPITEGTIEGQLSEVVSLCATASMEPRQRARSPTKWFPMVGGSTGTKRG